MQQTYTENLEQIIKIQDKTIKTLEDTVLTLQSVHGSVVEAVENTVLTLQSVLSKVQTLTSIIAEMQDGVE